MPKIIIAGILLLFINFNAIAQVDTLKWIDKNAQVLNSDGRLGESDLTFLKKDLKGKTIVGLGEGSHGTHEFYAIKRRIINYLIKQCGFRSVAFEAPDSIMRSINTFVQNGRGDLKQAMLGMGLYRTEEIHELFLNIRDYNQHQDSGKQVTLTGFDRREYWPDPFSRDSFMAKNVIDIVKDNDMKVILWAHNVHIMKDTTAEYLPMGGHLQKHFGDRYFALALDTYQGSVSVLDQHRNFESHQFQTNENTLSGLMSKANSGRFYLKFNEKTDPFHVGTSLITNIYSNWGTQKTLPIRPGKDFDAILFIRQTTHSIELK
ncbi:erythromycin esterase family protein [Pedobacter deserti]|uniref:erythromycin esterase family protein n=1 Tax=Pedobacter deserti TaxID=2817382 RepID=UPI00210A0E70|nr:erythromycin esterase family protein [Pedobacter sp. SYSU D00382]